MRVLLALLLWLVPVSVEAMPLRTKIALGCFSVGSYWDAINTAYCDAKGVCHEANPVYRPFVQRRGIVFTMTLKGAANTGLAALIIEDHQRHPVRAFWSAVGLCVAQGTVDVLNATTIRKATRATS